MQGCKVGAVTEANAETLTKHTTCSFLQPLLKKSFESIENIQMNITEGKTDNEGFLIAGGVSGHSSVEFWRPGHQAGDHPNHPDQPDQPEVHCALPPLPGTSSVVTVGVVHDELIACNETECFKFEGQWNSVHKLSEKKVLHTTTSVKDGLLLVGGQESPRSVELVYVNEGVSQVVHFLDIGRKLHCTIRISDKIVILTGGLSLLEIPGPDLNHVTELSNIPGKVMTKPLPKMKISRYNHACGTYSIKYLRSPRKQVMMHFF